jgi:GNAT superfamily N-acetyltransferase
VLEDGVEVARVELDDDAGINPTYANVPTIGPERLEIQYIEVATAARERGIGARVVQALAERHPDRRLMAYSEGADGFWASLSWDRFDHPEGQFHRPLFIQPTGWHPHLCAIRQPGVFCALISAATTAFAVADYRPLRGAPWFPPIRDTEPTRTSIQQ